MVRHTDTTDLKHEQTSDTPGKGLFDRATDYLRDLLTDPPHDPDDPIVAPGPLGLEWK